MSLKDNLSDLGHKTSVVYTQYVYYCQGVCDYQHINHISNNGDHIEPNNTIIDLNFNLIWTTSIIDS